MDDRLYRLPVIFVHFGKCDYLRYSVDKAAQTNPSSRIIVLTDEKQDLIERPNVEVHDLYDHFESARDFAPHYNHLSTNSFHFELACFQRWFAIKDFCEKEKIEDFFYCDSDVLLFCDIRDALESFDACLYTVTNNVSWGISLNKTSVLKDFCALCTRIYTKEDKFNFDKLMAHFAALQRNGKQGGVCDMSVVEIFRKDAFTPPGLVGEMSAIVKEEITDTESCFVRWGYSTFDHNINQADGFRMKNGTKEIEWRKRIPYCYNEFVKKWVKMNCLHFQGPAKRLMEECYDKA